MPAIVGCLMGCAADHPDFGDAKLGDTDRCGVAQASRDAGCDDGGAGELDREGDNERIVVDAGQEPRARDPEEAAADGGVDEEVDSGEGSVAERACQAGECFWSSDASATCRGTGLPDESYRPGTTLPGDVDDVYLAFSSARIGQTDAQGQVSEEAWRSFGFDLDGVCTNACAAGPVDQVSCQPLTNQLPFDGDLCRDNTFAKLQAIAAKLPNLGTLFGLTEEQVNCSLWRGSYNTIFRLSGYNGEADDDRVRLDIYTSLGLENQRDFTCPYPGFADSYPLWRASEAWLVDAADLDGSPAASGVLPDSKTFDEAAFVRDGYLVARLPDDALLRLAGDRSDFPGFPLVLQAGYFTGRLVRNQDASWSVEDGLMAGRVRREHLLTAWHTIGLCPGIGLDYAYDGVNRYVDESVDLLADGTNDASLPCDAVSVALGFEAAQVTPGAAVSANPLVDCCQPENAGSPSCPMGCGDGRLVGNEACDTGIPEGEPGACPTQCVGSDPCHPAIAVGEGCAKRCMEITITTPQHDDGCCPVGANATSDRDCVPVCGNGVVEAPAETCDPPGNCPTPTTCTSADMCRTAVLSGSADSCDATCTLTEVVACSAGDGCCPSGCDYDQDTDCPMPSQCGNGEIDAGETCDPPGSCPATCDDGDPCTEDGSVGSAATCDLRCVHQDKNSCSDGDGCCAVGCNATNDDDCGVYCGNGVLEPGESCDDGNSERLDGCFDCEIETPAEQCSWIIASRGGTSPECQACQCTNCAAEFLACANGPDAQENTLCGTLVQCGADSKCSGIACYCGAQSIFLCLSGGAAGPCVEETHAAAYTNNLSDVLNRQNDLQYPIGRANAVSTCTVDHCAEPCGLASASP